MDTIFPLKTKKAIKANNQAIKHNNAVMRLKIQNALYQQELIRVNAVNAALALEQQHLQHEAMVAQAQARLEHEAKVALAAHQREHEARVALAAQSHKQEAKIALAAQPHKQEVMAATHNKKAPFGKLISNMNKRQ